MKLERSESDQQWITDLIRKVDENAANRFVLFVDSIMWKDRCLAGSILVVLYRNL